MPQDTNGIRYLGSMLLGFSEMSWWQDEINERAAWARIGMAAEAGWVGEWIGGNLDFGWEVYDAGSGVLAIRSTGSDGTPMFFGRNRADTTKPVIGIDRAGRILEQPAGGELLDAADDGLTVPNDGTWYTLQAAYRVRQRAPGTLTLTGGSTTVTGVGTQFTRYADSADPDGGTWIRIDAPDTVQGNEGSYRIDTITSDTSMTLVTAPPATESGVEFRVKGLFYGSAPADPDIQNCPQITWTLETRTTTRPTTALIAYDVKRSGGVVTLIDRRRGNVWRPFRGHARSSLLMPTGFTWDNIDGTAGGGPGDATTVAADVGSLTLKSASATAASMVAMAMAPCSTGSELSGLAEDQPTGMMMAMLWDDNGSRAIRVYHHTVAGAATLETGMAGNWGNPDGGATTSVISGASGTQDVALVAIPANSGTTHICLYIDSSGLLKRRTSADNGASWSSEATVWDPTSTDTVSRVAVVLTRMNKIVVACAYSTGNRIRYIYSTDLGSTWDTNSNSGYSSSAAGEAVTDLTIVEDDDGNLWTIAAVASTNTLRMYRGQAEGNPLPASAEQTNGWKVGPDSGAAVTHLDAFAMPDGTVGVVYGHAAGSFGNGALGFVQLGRKWILHHQRLVARPLSSPLNTSDTLPVCVGVAASGVVHVGFGNRYLTSGANYNVAARMLQYVPVAVQRAHSWFGGT